MARLSELEQRTLEGVDDGQIVRDLTDLVAIPSVDGSPAEQHAQMWCADRLAGLGLKVDTWAIDIAEARMQPDFPGMEVERTETLGCVATLGATDLTPALALYGHTDVVPPGSVDLWPEGGPFELLVDASGRAWGRGACDMKAGVVATIAAVEAVCRTQLRLQRPLAVHCVSAEEDGGLGAWATLRRGHRADACVIAEPTSGSLVPANAGALTFRLDVAGLATHGSTRRRGVSALEKFELVHLALRQLEERRNRDAPERFDHLDLAWPLSVGIVSTGDWASTVPDRLVAEGRYGVRVDETVGAAMTAFELAVADTCDADPWLSEHPVIVSWPGGMFAPGSLPTAHRLLDDVRSAVIAIRDDVPPTLGAPYGSDLRHYIAAGIPALQFGPGDVRFAHATDEHVDLADVFACARVYALLVLRMCGVASE